MLIRSFLLSLFILSICGSKAQQNYSEDKKLAEALLLCTSHQGLVPEIVMSKYADTAKLRGNLKRIAIHWEKENLKRDSVKLSNTYRIPVDGTDTYMIIVYFRYRNLEWDELLLLASKKDGQLLDMANIQDAFYFKKNYRLRYDKNLGSLYNYFYPNVSTREEVKNAVIRVNRLVQEGKKDSLYQLVALKDSSFKKQPDTEKKMLQALLTETFTLVKKQFVASNDLEMVGSFTMNPKDGTSSQRFRCRETGRSLTFYFIKKTGVYFLYKTLSLDY